MPIKKEHRKYWIFGALAVISIGASIAYWQYQKLMDYCISVKKIKVNSIGFKAINFDVWINFLNKSAIKFVVVKQIYKIYLNDAYITTLSNSVPNSIDSKATSQMSLNVNINPEQVLRDIGLNAVTMALNYKSIIIKIDMKMKVKISGITFTVPYIYSDTLEGFMAPVPENKSTENAPSQC